MFDPVALPPLPQVIIIASHHFEDQDPEVIKRVAWAGEMACHWLFCPSLHDVAAVSIEANVKSVLSFSHILFATITAFDQVYHIARLAGGCGSDPEGSSGGCAPDGDGRLDVSAGETAPGVTAAGSTGWFNCGWLELRMDQEVTKTLGPAVGYQGPLRDGFLQAV